VNAAPASRAEAIRGLILPGMLSLLALGILLFLGTWQMQRLAWKENLIATVEERVRETPQLLPAAPETLSLDLRAEEYRPYVAVGRFLHEHEVQVYTSLTGAKGKFSGAGYWVLTPLARADGSVVIVNRGFVPLEKKDPASRAQGQVQGEQRVTGLLRLPEETNYFTPANDPAKNAWYSRKPDEIARAFGLKNVLPLMLDATSNYRAGDLPQPNETKLVFTNNHLGYALTWYGLACTLVGVFSVFAWQRVRGGK
jgi:surfeit locus 1 family protein